MPRHWHFGHRKNWEIRIDLIERTVFIGSVMAGIAATKIYLEADRT